MRYMASSVGSIATLELWRNVLLVSANLDPQARQRQPVADSRLTLGESQEGHLTPSGQRLSFANSTASSSQRTFLCRRGIRPSAAFLRASRYPLPSLLPERRGFGGGAVMISGA